MTRPADDNGGCNDKSGIFYHHYEGADDDDVPEDTSTESNSSDAESAPLTLGHSTVV